MKILAIDPGTYKSAAIFIDTADLRPLVVLTLDNLDLLAKLRENRNMKLSGGYASVMVIEQLKSYGNAIGDSVLMTMLWTGRMIEAFGSAYKLIPRKTICNDVCQNVRAGDSNIRQALIDWYAERARAEGRTGTDSAVAMGTRHDRGALYGIKRDEWQALAVAHSFVAQQKLEAIEIKRALL